MGERERRAEGVVVAAHDREPERRAVGLVAVEAARQADSGRREADIGPLQALPYLAPAHEPRQRFGYSADREPDPLAPHLKLVRQVEGERVGLGLAELGQRAAVGDAGRNGERIHQALGQPSPSRLAPAQGQAHGGAPRVGFPKPRQRLAADVGAGQQLRIDARARVGHGQRHGETQGSREETLEPEIPRQLQHVGAAVGGVLVDLAELPVQPHVRHRETADVRGREPRVDGRGGTGLRDRLAQADVIHPELDLGGGDGLADPVDAGGDLLDRGQVRWVDPGIPHMHQVGSVAGDVRPAVLGPALGRA